MDIIQEYALSAYHLYNSPTVLQARSTFYSLQSSLLYTLLPLMDRALSFLQGAPAIVGFGALLLFAITLFKIVSFVQRIMLYPVRIAWYIAVRAAIVGVLALLWKRAEVRGVDGLADDAGAVVGWVQDVAGFWWEQYSAYSGQGQQGPAYQQRRPGGQTGQRRYGNRASWS